MTIRVEHLFVVLSSLGLGIACSSQDPCADDPDLIICTASDDTTGGETGNGPGESLCAPFDNGETGMSYACQGTGNGWLEVSIYPLGAQPPECLEWDEAGKPNAPTSADCVAIDVAALPNGIPGPGACCNEEAMPEDVTEQCEKDCGYAACKVAVSKLRDAASTFAESGAEGVVRDDLTYLAGLLEMPSVLDACATRVTDGAGEFVSVAIGSGISSPAEFGHVQDATLYLQCELDELEPYILEGGACEAPPNTPLTDEGSSMGGSAVAGAVSVDGPAGLASAGLHDIEFAFTEFLERDGTTHFRLDEFSASAETTAYGSFVFTNPSLRLLSPAEAELSGEQLRFAPGSLRVEVTAAITADGEALFGGEPVSAEYRNSEIATAWRSVDGEFAFVAAPFEVSGYSLILNTESGSFELLDPTVD